MRAVQRIFSILSCILITVTLGLETKEQMKASIGHDKAMLGVLGIHSRSFRLTSIENRVNVASSFSQKLQKAFSRTGNIN